MKTQYLRPDWYLPIVGEPVRHPILDLHEATVSADTNSSSSSQIVRMEQTIALPGFVNAHTHLDLSGFPHPIGLRGTLFSKWVAEVIRHRSNPDSSGDSRNPIQVGLAESISFGTAVIGNICGKSWQATACEPKCALVTDFLEQLGTNPDLTDLRIGDLDQRLKAFKNGPATGISPHAPYSLDRKLFDATIEMSVRRSLPVAMHLAESPEERQLLDFGTGGLVETLRAAGVWFENTEFPDIEYCLQTLSRCKRALIIHGNYLRDAEFDLIAQHQDKMILVWCPRTHDWFGHQRWHYAKTASRGIQVALGTDSRASNPDLDLLAEMQYVATIYPEISPREILKMGTVTGWQSLESYAFGDPNRLPPALTILQYGRKVSEDPESTVLFETPTRRTVIWTANR